MMMEGGAALQELPRPGVGLLEGAMGPIMGLAKRWSGWIIRNCS